MRGHQNQGTRRRARQGSPERRSRTDGEGGVDAWAEYLQARQQADTEQRLPGPFGASAVPSGSPTSRMERGERGEGNATSVFVRQNPGEAGSVGTFSSSGTPQQPSKKVFQQTGVGGATASPGDAGAVQATSSVEQQLALLTQAVTALQSNAQPWKGA